MIDVCKCQKSRNANSNSLSIEVEIINDFLARLCAPVIFAIAIEIQVSELVQNESSKGVADMADILFFNSIRTNKSCQIRKLAYSTRFVRMLLLPPQPYYLDPSSAVGNVINIDVETTKQQEDNGENLSEPSSSWR